MIFALALAFVTEINVYFETDNLPHQLAVAVSRATSSLDIAFHQIYEDEVVDSIISAHERGVRVRIITEHDYFGRTWRLRNAGITVVDEFNDPNAQDHRMHDKFVVIDFRDDDTTNDWVWNGSYNASSALHADNAIFVRSHSLATIFEAEFNQMWGDTSDIPNRGGARTGIDKTDVAPFHSVYIDSVLFEVYFSPQDTPINYVRHLVQNADSTIDFCIFYYTYYGLANDMIDRLDNGVTVRGVFDSSAVAYTSTVFDMLSSAGANVVISHTQPRFYYLHHKFMVVDNSVVETGSMNWTVSGTSYNDENIMIIHSPNIARLYEEEFADRFHEAGSISESAVDAGREPILTATPSIFTDRVKFNAAGVAIYNVSGQLVGKAEGREFNGAALPPGVYLAVKGRARVRLVKLR